MNNWKNWAIVLLLAALGVTLYLFAKQRQKANGNSAEVTLLQGDVIRYKNEAGQWLSKLEGTQSAYNEVYAELEKIKGELAKSGIDPTNIKSVTTIKWFVHDTVRLDPVVVSETTDDGLTPPIDEELGDGIKGADEYPSFHYEDEWATIDLKQQMWWWSMDYKVRDIVTLAVEQKQRAFKPDYVAITSMSQNPNVIVQGIDYLEVPLQDKKWGIGPQVGFGFNGSGFSPYIGVGVQYNVFKFKF